MHLLLEFTNLYYEPFYQLMRQTLLAEECVKNSDHNITAYSHVHVIPENNFELKSNITSPYFKNYGVDNIHDAWKILLKDNAKYIIISPENLLKPVLKVDDSKSFINYLKVRYWE